MDRQAESSSEGSKEHGGLVSPSSLVQDFQFTFSCSTRSGSNSIIEPDPSAEEFGDTSSQSLTDSVQNFPEEFGRTYHAYKAGSYPLPNDMLERERLVYQGAALHKLFGDRLFFAPLSQSDPPGHILDIATGCGDWAVQMGDLFPSAQVVATDLSPIQPDIVPPNVNFYIEDSSEPWYYTEKFDYIHTRVTTGSWANFKTQIADQAFEALNPGGWFESQEFDCLLISDDGTLDPQSAMSRWMQDMINAAQLCNRPFVMAANVKQAYIEAGFVDVHEKLYKMPINAWPKDERLKELGRMWQRNMTTGLSGFSVWLFNRVYNRSPAETEVLLVDVRREMSDPRIHAYMPITVVWGRKPYPYEVAGPS
ncbi:hypothetical protein S40285_03859 [Stachybotrys chlorohalonatus IBT 40285]|uniref:Methyltransferase domain-containing protein n=1 Tax=Stachybotrys chlorohalonatus (strain IBT 40285) TaxID=1283841 RepID=A0A084QLV9_STAC4|nr:hypothetical protein S40285_03859 [Stachybotrys chlorohalonata IBT 40285]